MRAAALALAAALLAQPARAVEIALTFDDLPAHSALPPGETRAGVARDVLRALERAEAPATGFVNGGFLQAEPDSGLALRLWREAGRPFGNHTWSHLRLTSASSAAFEADVVRNEALLAALAEGRPWRWFRYPFLAEGETPEVRARAQSFLKARGYRIASVTLDFGDWAYNDPYARCAARGDAAAVAGLEARFLAAAAESLDRARALSLQAEGREVPLVLLLHLGAFDARMMDRLLDLYRSRGVRFVSLDRALADPFYRADAEALPSPEPLTLEAAVRRQGLEPPHAPSVAGLSELCR